MCWQCPKNLSQASAKLIKLNYLREEYIRFILVLMYDQPLNLFNKSQLSEGVELTALVLAIIIPFLKQWIVDLNLVDLFL